MHLSCQNGFCLGVLVVFFMLKSEVVFVQGIHLPYVNQSFNKIVYGNVSKENDNLWKYEYTRSRKTDQAVRLEVSSEDASVTNPVVLVARLQKGVLSWSLPTILEEGSKYLYSSRTLCPKLESNASFYQPQYFHVHVATASPTVVRYALKAFFLDDFELSLNVPVDFNVNPAAPEYKVFKFPGNVDTVRVVGISNSENCAIVSIQNTQCPVYDLARNVEFTGYFQTMTKKAAITIQKKEMNQFYVVVIVKSTDTECETGYRTANPISHQDDKLASLKDQPPLAIVRNKIVTIKIEPVLSARKKQGVLIFVRGRSGTERVSIATPFLHSDEYHVKGYIHAIVFPIFVFGLFYFVTFLFIVGIWCKQRGLPGRSFLTILMPKKMPSTKDEDENESLSPLMVKKSSLAAPASRSKYGSLQKDTNEVLDVQAENNELKDHAYDSESHSGPSVEHLEKDYDMLHDLEHEKDIYRLRTYVTVADMSKKNRKYLKKKYKLYHWNMIVVAVFYTLPVLQLVITYQNVLKSSGDEDICYYNFFCAHPAGLLSAFNNVYSNIGYILLGILFFFIVLRRDRLHKQAIASKDLQEKLCGIPKHYEIFYAMAMALVMEGVLSGCYHICPNNSNFQFDTSFMYIITCLGMIKVYQTRHPDIVASAHRVYVLFAGIILIAVIGVLFSTTLFWSCFCVIHITISLYLSSQLYYMGRFKFDSGMLTRMLFFLRYDCCACPAYKDRMMLLIIANAVNWIFAICGVVYQPKDFATYLLVILIVNGLLYVGFYVIMKIRNKEHILLLPCVVSILSLICWIAALVFFFQEVTSWQKSPAKSREGNRECRLLGFYDDHDIWHLLSATALFFSFLAVLTLDDDLEDVPRKRIPAF